MILNCRFFKFVFRLVVRKNDDYISLVGRLFVVLNKRFDRDRGGDKGGRKVVGGFSNKFFRDVRLADRGRG